MRFWACQANLICWTKFCSSSSRAIDVFFLLQPETIAKNVTNCESFKQIIPPVVQLHTLQCAEQN